MRFRREKRRSQSRKGNPDAKRRQFVVARRVQVVGHRNKILETDEVGRISRRRRIWSAPKLCVIEVKGRV